MPKYRISVQDDVDIDAPERLTRDTRSTHRIHVDAESMTDALILALANTMGEQRIVAVEECLFLDTEAITDEQIANALTSPKLEDATRLDPEDFEDYSVENDDDRAGTIEDVAEALRESELVSGLTLTLEHNSEGWVDYVMVEIYDVASSTYRSVGRDPRHLIGDRSLSGWDAIVSIARTLIETVSSEELL